MIVSIVSLASVIAALVALRPESRRMGVIYWPAAIIKVVAGLAVAWLYRFYYEDGDILSFFSDAIILSDFARDNVSQYVAFLWSGDDTFPVWDALSVHQHRSLFMVKLLSVGALLSGDNYWVASALFSLISFSGAWYFCRTVQKNLPDSFHTAAIAFLFYPSIVFWTSGILKEAMAFPALLFLSGIVVKIWWNKRLDWKEAIFILLSVLLLWKLKYFYLGVFAPVALTAIFLALWRREKRNGRTVAALLVGCVVLTVAAVGMTRLHPNFDLYVLPGIIEQNYHEQVSQSAKGRYLEFPGLQPDWESMAKNIPMAIFSGLFRPLPWESNSVLMMVLAFENLILLIASLFAFFTFVPKRKLKQPLLVGLVAVYVLLLCAFVTLATPNFGTLSRFRTGYIGFFVWVVADALSPFINLTFRKRSVQNTQA